MPSPAPTADDLEARFEAELGPLVATLLGVVGPMTTERIRVVLSRAGHVAPLVAEGWDDADLQGLVDWVVDDELAFFRTSDDLVAHVPSLLDGIVLTHVLTAEEATHSMLDLGPDLSVLTRVAARLPLRSGGAAVVHHRWDQRPELAAAAADLGLPTHPRASDDGSLVGPPGWLAGLRPGRLVLVALHGRTLTVAACDRRPGPTHPTPGLVDALAAAAARRAPSPEDGDPADDLVLDALAHDPTLLRTPDAPLSLALAALGECLTGDTLAGWRP